MHPYHRRLGAGLATLVVTATMLVACSNAEEEARAALEAFLDGWTTGELDQVAFIDPLGDSMASADVAEQLATLSGDLGEQPPELGVAGLTANDGLATGDVTVDWPLPGGATWSYPTTVRLDEGDSGWRVIWNPAVVHPELVDGDELLLRRAPAARGEILDGTGEPLMSMRPVRDIGVWPSQVTDVEELVDELDTAFRSVGVVIEDTMAELPDRIEEAREDDLRVPVVTLRQDDYQQIAGTLADREEILVDDDEWYLAPSRTFAQALLGSVGDVTAEIIDENPGVYQEGDRAGLSGLSRQYDEQLRGVPGQTVTISRDELELGRIEPVPGTDLQLTLETGVQQAAEAALAAEPNRAALVAVRVSDGAVLAVANTEGEQANPVDLALTGAVAPGSTFKMVTGYGLLDAGEVTLDQPVPCPAQLTVDGFEIGNAFSGDRGEIPFREAMAISCNTAFAELGPRLGDDGLATAGSALGLGGDWDLGTDVFTGTVPTGGSTLDQAQASYGQWDTQVSPAAMAVATATVARGAWLPPALVVDPEAPDPEPTALTESAVTDLHAALRAVVTDGTGSALQDTPGGDVFGKTGTAEAGEEVEHAWFVGWQDDLAFAVFVEDGGGGSSTAAPLADAFLRNLG